MKIRVVGHIVIFPERGEEFLDDDAGVFVVERVVFLGSICVPITPASGGGFGLVGSSSRIDKDAQHDGNFASVDQIVDHPMGLDIPGLGFQGLAVVEHHQCRGIVGRVLGGDVDPVGVLGARKNIRRDDVGTDKMSLGHAFLGHGIRSQAVVSIHFRVPSSSFGGAPCGLRDEVGRQCGHDDEGENELFHIVVGWALSDRLNGSNPDR